jgi:hypothetical protein
MLGRRVSAYVITQNSHTSKDNLTVLTANNPVWPYLVLVSLENLSNQFNNIYVSSFL